MIKTRKNLAAFAFMLAMLFIFSSLTYAQDKVNIEDENLSGVENEQVYNFSLNDAIEYALENNKQLEINDSIIKAAEIKVQEEKANQRKALNVKFTVPYASTTMAFEILTKRGYYVELAEYQLEVAKKTKERDIKALQATVQNNYYNLKTSVKKYNIAQSIEKHALENLKAVELKYKLGLASEIELLGAKTAAKKATADKNASERSVNLSRMTFNRSIGLPVFAKVNLTDDIKIEKYKEVDLNEKVELALENRLEMYNAKRVYELDKLYIEAMEAYTTKNTYVYRSALANTQTGELYLSLAEDAVRQSVCKSYYDMVNAYEMIEILEQSEQQAQKAYDIAVIKYDAGMITNNEVTDALNKLQEAQVNKEQGYLAYQLAKITFEHSYGIGIGNDQIPYKPPQTGM